MAEELVKTEGGKQSWLDELEKRLTLAQPPVNDPGIEQETVVQDGVEMPYEAPRNLVSGGEDDFGGETVIKVAGNGNNGLRCAITSSGRLYTCPVVHQVRRPQDFFFSFFLFL